MCVSDDENIKIGMCVIICINNPKLFDRQNL